MYMYICRITIHIADGVYHIVTMNPAIDVR